MVGITSDGIKADLILKVTVTDARVSSGLDHLGPRRYSTSHYTSSNSSATTVDADSTVLFLSSPGCPFLITDCPTLKPSSPSIVFVLDSPHAVPVDQAITTRGARQQQQLTKREQGIIAVPCLDTPTRLFGFSS